MRPIVLAVLILVGASCADGGGAPASGAQSPPSPARVDLVEAGIRAVVSPNDQTKLLYVRTRLCPGMTKGQCAGALTGEEIAALGDGLVDLAPEVRFVSNYDAI